MGNPNGYIPRSTILNSDPMWDPRANDLPVWQENTLHSVRNHNPGLHQPLFTSEPPSIPLGCPGSLPSSHNRPAFSGCVSAFTMSPPVTLYDVSSPPGRPCLMVGKFTGLGSERVDYSVHEQYADYDRQEVGCVHTHPSRDADPLSRVGLICELFPSPSVPGCAEQGEYEGTCG